MLGVHYAGCNSVGGGATLPGSSLADELPHTHAENVGCNIGGAT